MALVEAARFFTRFEASLAKARLDAADIPNFLFDMETNWGGADLGVVPVRLMVDDEDLEPARAILAEEGS
jgi:putative signal transducing protein